MDCSPNDGLRLPEFVDVLDGRRNSSLTVSQELVLFSLLLGFDHILHIDNLRVCVECKEEIADESVAAEATVIGRGHQQTQEGADRHSDCNPS
jgi:hypothetical protein